MIGTENGQIRAHCSYLTILTRNWPCTYNLQGRTSGITGSGNIRGIRGYGRGVATEKSEGVQ